MTKQPETKTCRYCGKEFARTANDHASNWKTRQFCSSSCSARSRQERKPYKRDKTRSLHTVITPPNTTFIWG